MKITKKEAAKQFKKGNLITFVPSKCDLQSMMSSYGSLTSYDTFADACKDKEHYYCSKLNGLRLNFYI